MGAQQIYYFDNNATTRMAPEVVEAMLPFLRDGWGNPSSPYQLGRQASGCLEEARAKVAALINAEPREVVFTSGGTESINAALHSALIKYPRKRHLVLTAVEHSASLNYGKFLQTQGYEVTLLPVDGDGNLNLGQVEQSIRPDTAIVSVMYANNETGVIFPIADIAEICHRLGTVFHTDAVQAAGKLKLDVKDLEVDFLSLSAHKLRAPKGVGLLYVGRHTRFQPYLLGGHQERDRRAGTENVAGIVGFGRAAELAVGHCEEENTRVRALRDRLEETILKTIPHTSRNGVQEPRLPNTTNIAFDQLKAEEIILLLDQLGICVSGGSACLSGALDPSHVLRAMGISPTRSQGSIRFSLGLDNTDEEVSFLLQHLVRIIKKLRQISSLDIETGDELPGCKTGGMPQELVNEFLRWPNTGPG
jgi:cysteine desulfurase